jgi:hypothetical protein
MALGSTQPQPVLGADNLTAICEPTPEVREDILGGT